ncbi:MAG: hydrogenase maturation nickel metallochaperone HypA [Bacteroidetes bacterium]|nr:hydrogenase maturation nickel metallochaperone HypA [Bacteroidota bacterium]
MHELSIVMSIVAIAQQEVQKAQASIVDEIEMDIGCLSTIEMDAFEMAWKQGIKQTILQHAAKKINRLNGKATCSDCGNIFAIQQVYEACPNCGSHFIHITQGKELRVKSLLLS